MERPTCAQDGKEPTSTTVRPRLTPPQPGPSSPPVLAATRPGLAGFVFATALSMPAAAIAANPLELRQQMLVQIEETTAASGGYNDYAAWAAAHPKEAEAELEQSLDQYGNIAEVLPFIMPLVGFVLVLKNGGTLTQAMQAAAMAAFYGLVGRVIAQGLAMSMGELPATQ